MRSSRPDADPALEFPRRVVTLRRLPAAFEEMDEPPEVAQVWGAVPPGPYVGIVGRRLATEQGIASARRLARELAELGVTVVSGGALGVDAAAHQGALDAGGRTLVLAPLWFDRAYPEQNRPLFAEILRKGGGYLSLSGEGDHAFNAVFFRRNEALAALCQIVVVGECRYRSGAQNTVKYARRLERPLFVLPSLYGNSSGVGSNALLGRGAQPVQSARQLVKLLASSGNYGNPEFWPHAAATDDDDDAHEPRAPRLPRAASVGIAPGPPPKKGQRSPRKKAKAPELAAAVFADPDEALSAAPGIAGGDLRSRLLGALRRGATTLDDVLEKTGISAKEAQHELLLLTLAGEVSEDERGLLRYHPRPHVRS